MCACSTIFHTVFADCVKYNACIHTYNYIKKTLQRIMNRKKTFAAMSNVFCYSLYVCLTIFIFILYTEYMWESEISDKEGVIKSQIHCMHGRHAGIYRNL